MDLGQILGQISNTLKKINKRQRIIIFTTLVVLISFVTYLLLFKVDTSENYEGYSVLFNGVDPADSALILQELSKNKISYKIPNESTILVPNEQVYEQRIHMASIGFPRQGKKIGFNDFLENNNLGNTDFREQTTLRMAVEGELTNTIESLTAVQSASVLIAPGSESVFARDSVPPTASVKLTLRPGNELSTEQVIGIKNLVASAVTNLTPQNVKVVDQDGSMLGEDTEAARDNNKMRLADQQRRFQTNLEKIFENKIIHLLQGIVGDEKGVRAQVSTEYDFSQVKQTSEIFGNNIPSAQRIIEEYEKGVRDPTIGGVPGVVSNIGPVQGLNDDGILTERRKNDEQINFSVDRTVSEHTGQIGQLKRVAVSVIVDGTYIEVEDENGKRTLQYVPRTEHDMKEIENLVKGVIVYNEERGDYVKVSNLQLAHKLSSYRPKDGWETFSEGVERYLGPFVPLLKYVLVAVVLFIFYKKIIAPFTERMLEVQDDEDDEVESLLQLDDEDDEDLNRFSELRKRVEDQLGLGGGFNEDEVKYEVILERMRNVISERPEEIASLFQTLIRDELEISPVS